MIRNLVRLGGVTALLVLLAGAAGAQTTRGTFLLSDGSTPRQEVRFYLAGGDGSRNQYYFSDSQGRFILERLPGNIDYTITVDSDGVHYAQTVYSFRAGIENNLRIFLRASPAKPIAKSSTVSAASARKPASEAETAYDSARKEVEKQDFAAAEKHFRQAIAADASYVAPLNDLGALLMHQRRYAEAETVLRKAIELDPKHVQAQLNLGVTLHRLSRYKESVVPLREAVRLERDLSAGHLFLGGSLVELDQFEEAERELNQAAGIAGVDEAGLNLFRGKLYARTGEFAKSISALEKYLELAPKAQNAPEVRALIDRLRAEASRKP